ncbi:putative membrane protein [Paucimonas lemoignei]|uniref:Putative membrane protein n=1 Tax=Paucimonas lemoignei TaxID=29443 RepID=A0A4R3HPP2_PAULE|nr:DUF2214 family protein [Paucimonas lemoignei]TCS33714.1 putative membrane protein [Paucimonas lemoignei]
MTPFLAFLHHLAIFILFGALVAELVLLQEVLTLRSARKIRIADMVYGAAAGTVIVVGLLRVFYFEKGAAYYLHSVPFWIKMAAFVSVGVVSIWPTIEFFSWARYLKAGQAPVITPQKLSVIRKLIHLELIGIMIILLAAAFMAKGIGYVG